MDSPWIPGSQDKPPPAEDGAGAAALEQLNDRLRANGAKPIYESETPLTPEQQGEEDDSLEVAINDLRAARGAPPLEDEDE